MQDNFLVLLNNSPDKFRRIKSPSYIAHHTKEFYFNLNLLNEDAYCCGKTHIVPKIRDLGNFIQTVELPFITFLI